VYVTRLGGLFIDHPGRTERGNTLVDDAKSRTVRIEHRRQVATILNVVICELALRGVYSTPVAAVEVCTSVLVENRARVAASTGPGHLRLAEEDLPSSQHALRWIYAGERVLRRLGELAHARELQRISEVLPGLVAAAHLAVAYQRPEESVVNCWVVTEQLINHVWTSRYCEQAIDAQHKERLKDHRTFSAAVREEILLASGVIDTESYSLLHPARKLRNDLAHNARMGLNPIQTSWSAMRAALILVFPDWAKDELLITDHRWRLEPPRPYRFPGSPASPGGGESGQADDPPLGAGSHDRRR
jgi:hypothetical protein